MYMCIRMYKIFLRCLLEPQCCYDDVRFVSERPRERNTHTRRNYWILSRRLFECNSERAAVMHVLVCVHVMCLCMCVCACVWAHDGMSSHKKVQLAMTTRWKITHTHAHKVTCTHSHELFKTSFWNTIGKICAFFVAAFFFMLLTRFLRSPRTHTHTYTRTTACTLDCSLPLLYVRMCVCVCRGRKYCRNCSWFFPFYCLLFAFI